MTLANAKKAINRDNTLSLHNRRTLRSIATELDNSAAVASNTSKIAAAAAVTAASEAHALNATFSDTEVEAALNALGAKINAIIAALT